MSPSDLLREQRSLLSERLDAIMRCLYFLSVSVEKLNWPITTATLEEEKKNVDLFESLAAMNERFSKLQDLLASAMRQSAGLAGEETRDFLRVIAFFSKIGVIADEEAWRTCRAFRNLSAHEYSTDPQATASHFNTLHELAPVLAKTSQSLIEFCEKSLAIHPQTGDFTDEFKSATRRF